MRQFPNFYLVKVLIFRRILVTNETGFIFNQALDEKLGAAFMTSMTDAVYRNQKNYKRFVHNICKQQLLSANTVLYYPKNFYLIDEINEQIRTFSAAGLIDHWIAKHLAMRFYNVRKVGAGPSQLSVEHLSGIFNILLIGFLVSAFAFACEFLFRLKSKILKAPSQREENHRIEC